MRMVKNLLLFLVMLLLGLYIFMPKTEVYYKLEEMLQQKNIVIGNEKIESTLRSFKVMHPVVYFQGAKLARAENVVVKPYLLVNSVNLKDVEPLGIAKELGDVTIDRAILKQSILKPLFVKVAANGSFGEAHGYIDLKQHLVHIDIANPKNIAPLKRVLKKGEKGWYYESNF